jgi:RimJ/RimL family protein N-acetyltransferase
MRGGALSLEVAAKRRLTRRMAKRIPKETIDAFARTIQVEARKYGFGLIDLVRLMNSLMDVSLASQDRSHDVGGAAEYAGPVRLVDSFPLRSALLQIRLAEPTDVQLLEEWLQDSYGRHFLLSCATAQQHRIEALMSNSRNELGIVALTDGRPIGAVAFLDIDRDQRRAELRKLIGVKTARGKGYAEEATRLWVEYGLRRLGLEKIYVSTLQNHIRNIRLNESVGFHVEGVLRQEVLLNGARHDVLRMGLCASDVVPPSHQTD